MAVNEQPDSRAGRERRQHDRFLCQLRMSYTILTAHDVTPFEYGVAYSRDLSESGVCIFTEREIGVPTLMQLNISIPVRPFHMLILGKTVWCRPGEDSDLFDIGLKFVGILPADFKALLAEFGETDTE